MKLLIYFNILYKNFLCVFDNSFNDLEVGELFKVNSLLVARLDLNEKPSLLKITKRKLKRIPYKIGKFLIKIGERLVYKKSRKQYVTIIKERYPWWR